MMRKMLFWAVMLQAAGCHAQDAQTWNHKGCAVVLTYDDGIDADLDRIAPALDSVGLKATFYVIGASSAVAGRLAEWRLLAQHGHELGNHSLFHPCEGGPGRAWVQGDNDLRRYTVKRVVDSFSWGWRRAFDQ
jgi:peptidoglycan/xylan/chitin deacetylase (PgdA/CDA1 family)